VADPKVPIQLLSNGDIAGWNEWRQGSVREVVVDISGVDLTGAFLSGADLTHADLTRADLTRATLIGADLTEANLAGANLKGATLADADLTRAILYRASLARADLTDAILTGAILIGADLYGAKLLGAILVGAQLGHVNLTGADLTGAFLNDANLKEAYLTGAVLTEVDFAGADLTGADLTDTDLSTSQRSSSGGTDFAFELEEIESALRAVPGVLRAVAVVRDREFLGYVVPLDPSRNLMDDLLSSLHEVLPRYLVPAAILQLDAMPVRPDGRIDRGALPSPLEFSAPRSIVVSVESSSSQRADEQVSAPRVFVSLTELRMPLPDGIDPSEIAQIVEAFAALARLVVKVGVDITPPNAEPGSGSAALALATRSPASIEITTRRLHYGSDLVMWLVENWQFAVPSGAAVSTATGFTIRDLLKRHDSKILGLLYTIFTSDGRQKYTLIKKATDDALLAEAISLEEKSNAEARKHRADSAEDTVRYLKAKQQLAAISQELARENVMGADLANETLAEIADALGALEPITSRGLTATTVLAAPDDRPPDVD